MRVTKTVFQKIIPAAVLSMDGLKEEETGRGKQAVSDKGSKEEVRRILHG